MGTADRSRESTAWLDLIKAVAVLWIFLNHVVERVIDSPYISNPNSAWPPLAVRIRQLIPIDFGSPSSDTVMNFLRYLGWAGDQGVQIFLIASGFGLTWSILKRGSNVEFGEFLRRRVWRIYPLWWGAHLLFLGLSVFVGGKGMSPLDPRFYLSMAGFRATPGMMYYFSPAWWYIGLAIQLYLVFPFLAAWLRRLGPGRFLVVTLGPSFAIRLAGLYVFDSYLDAWSRGAIFITRLPEFVFGMALAWWFFEKPEASDRALRRPTTLLLGIVTYSVATGLALTLWGMALAPFLHGVSAFILLYTLIQVLIGRSGIIVRSLLWIGALSYSVYLTHHPVILFLMDRQQHPTLAALAVGVPVFGIAVLLAVLLEWSVSRATTLAARWTTNRGMSWITLRLMLLAAALTASMFAAEVTVRALDPQEVNGWGERSSLEPHEGFGWRLKPDRTTRLRWESYDYTVTANSLGFPGPLYAGHAPPGTFRIMTLGDAFTSAEGVDTEQSWPRLLEDELDAMVEGVRIEVLNFAITGYGPNQYAAVLEAFGPRFGPDVVLVGFFVNEYVDVKVSNDAFRRSIGFGARDPNGVVSYLEAAHLRRWMQINIAQPLREWATGNPRSQGYFLGNFHALAAGGDDDPDPAPEMVRERLSEMKAIADRIRARLIVVQIPAPVQICGPDDLAYYPRNVDLEDTQRYDVDRPQRTTNRICADLGIETFDLRAPLSECDTCPYQPRNMHWLPSGHRAVATFLADALAKDERLQSRSEGGEPPR